MENINKLERSELWNEIYAIVKQIPRKETNEDAVDAPSATTSIEKLILKYKVKAEKWDELEVKIANIYNQENDSLDEEEGSLLDIGEISALAFGFL